MPNCIETLVAKLAVNSLGAVWSCASPDFGSHVNSIEIKIIEKIYF
jgi:hypothetical protein